MNGQVNILNVAEQFAPGVVYERLREIEKQSLPRIRSVLPELHRLSVAAGENRQYALEAALHRIYTVLDEASA
jgi:hypothetical protein